MGDRSSVLYKRQEGMTLQSACTCMYLCLKSQNKKWESEKEKKKDTWASSLAVLKKLLLNTTKRVQNDEHSVCSFHIEEIAFGNFELAGMMRYTNPPPHMHANMHFFASTLRIQKRSYSQGQSWADTSHARAGSHLGCVHGLDEHSNYWKSGNEISVQTLREKEA